MDEHARDAVDTGTAADADASAAVDPAAHWEQRYASRGPVWSGGANTSLVAAVAELDPGAALDLGCGEGGDAIWLAQTGWKVFGVDLSPTAVRRATDAARSAGLGDDRVSFVAADLATWTSEDRFDLVSAAFLQSMVELPRTAILRRAAGWVRPGGHLLIVSHAAPPPWAAATFAERHAHPSHFPTPSSELAELALDDAEWSVVVAEVPKRRATGPDGEDAILADTVVMLRRR
jgi:SAM-dependent methyltransferase